MGGGQATENLSSIFRAPIEKEEREMDCLRNFATPQLEKIHSGKVRDSFRIDDTTRMIVVTDRLSAFDSVLKTPIPYKGGVLNGISNFWFDQTQTIIGSHFLEMLDPNITLVKEAAPIRVEMIVRGYLTGSMWRGYQQGRREFSGVRVPDGMTKNQAFPQPIVTPTTKEKSDREITPAAIVSEGWADQAVYDQMQAVAQQLFALGARVLREKGIILVDTKYEFGLLNGELILIDEIHTPDSSRFWRAADYEQSPDSAAQIDKEYVRQWLLQNKVDGQYPQTLPENVVAETSRRYLEIYRMVTGAELAVNPGEPIKTRMCRNLVKAGLIKDGYVAIVMGSPGDLEYCQKIRSYLAQYDIMTEFRIVSAHKNGEAIVELAREYNASIEPAAVIAVAGRSNGLGGALAANLNLPVINCPPFQDAQDMLLNLNSSLMMPSKTPAMTVVHPKNAAHAALRSLNLPRLRDTLTAEIDELKRTLRAADQDARQRAAESG